MEIEKMGAVLRPRTAWESTDLGVALLRRWLAPVLLAWMVTVVPVCALIMVVLRDHPIWGGVVLFWLKPTFERVPLFVLSRALFGTIPTPVQVLREVPRLWSTRPWLALFGHRIHPARSVLQPIAVLEVAHRGSYLERERVIGHAAAGTAILVAFLALLMEIVLWLGGLLLLEFLLPDALLPPEPATWSEIQLVPDGWYAGAMAILWILAYTIAGTLHAAAGFGLYLNRRSQIEGWDVELAFRRLAARVQSGARPRAALGTATALCALLSTPGLARAQSSLPAQDRETPEAAVREVLADPEFGSDTVERDWSLDWDPDWGTELSSEGADAGLALVGQLLEIALWAGVAILAVYVFLLVARHLGWFAPAEPAAARTRAPVTHVFGLDVRRESLPVDVPGTARALWHASRKAEALALLYRAAIASLVRRESLALEPGDTENDCLRRARAGARAARAGYFADVTSAWLGCAYADRPPSVERFEELCAGWLPRFEEPA
jgi:hypothetical protein